jgi:2-oxoglutarate ferredoxin oxidoreductase subunit delta
MASNKKKARCETSPTVTNGYWQTKLALEKNSILLFDQHLFPDWCKACGICIAFCPKNVFTPDQTGKPVISRADACSGCRFCELHCPDFAITITKRFVDRRRSDDK